jgi:hypothetical protein
MILTRRCMPTDTRRSHVMMRDTPNGGFKVNRGMTGLLCISVIAMLVTEASALCPVGYTYIGGKCYKTKGVDCEVDLKRLGNVEQHPKSLDCNILLSGEVAGVLFCGNPASRQPPGHVPAVFSGSFGGSTAVDPNDVDKHGNAHVQVIAVLSDTQLGTLASQYCPNASFTGLDFVPCAFTSEVTLVNDETSGTIETAKDSCSLPDCQSLKWNKNTNMPEQRDYDCVGPIP